MRKLLSGNEAIARGAFEAGARAGFGYPGTPSTEILENLVKYKDQGIYCEWSPNEKVAMEAAVGASFCGARVVVTMKCVGLNVAADPLMTLAYIGVEGGLVLVVADDPGQHSSQTEQDTRQYARLAKIPVLEPSDAQECKDFIKYAFELSEKYRIPVILRTTTRVSHSRSLVDLKDRTELDRTYAFDKNPAKHCPLPIWGRQMRKDLEQKQVDIAKEGANHPANREEIRSGELGIITSSMAYQYVRDVFPDASVLKLGLAFPFPDEAIRSFAAKVKQLVVIEELDNFLEEHVKSLGLDCKGRELFPVCGELSAAKLHLASHNLLGTPMPEILEPASCIADLPGRPPVFCPGCPHRGLFYALGKFDVIVTGDIGCYSLGVFPPLSRTDCMLCMGGGISMAQGIEKAGETRKVVGVVGDSTFFHSGITGLIDIVYNRGNSTIVVLDNRTTAMTGHQNHPGTGQTLMEEPTVALSIEKLGEACGVKRIRVVNPYEIRNAVAVIKEEIEADEPSLIISRAPCPLKERKPIGPAKRIDPAKCKNCKSCLKLGCPAIEYNGDKISINHLACAGCQQCAEVCPFDAIE